MAFFAFYGFVLLDFCKLLFTALKTEADGMPDSSEKPVKQQHMYGVRCVMYDIIGTIAVADGAEDATGIAADNQCEAEKRTER